MDYSTKIPAHKKEKKAIFIVTLGAGYTQFDVMEFDFDGISHVKIELIVLKVKYRSCQLLQY